MVLLLRFISGWSKCPKSVLIAKETFFHDEKAFYKCYYLIFLVYFCKIINCSVQLIELMCINQ